MKQNELLLWGGAAIAAYFLFIKPKAPVPAAASPNTPVIIPAPRPVSSTSGGLLDSVNQIISQVTKAITPAAPAIVSVQTPITPIATPVIAPGAIIDTPVVDDSAYYMFLNKDYPGALAGYILEERYN